MKGVIDKIWQNKTKAGKPYWVLGIGGENYSVWDKNFIEGLEEGTPVEYEWTPSGDFKKITGVREIEMDPNLEPERPNYRNQQIVRMSCIKSATALVSNSDANPNEKGEITLGLARKFEKYVAQGDEGTEEGEKEKE